MFTVHLPNGTDTETQRDTDACFPPSNKGGITSSYFKSYTHFCTVSDENFPEKFKSENFLENFPFFYKDS
jgi:hypothetical protein